VAQRTGEEAKHREIAAWVTATDNLIHDLVRIG